MSKMKIIFNTDKRRKASASLVVIVLLVVMVPVIISFSEITLMFTQNNAKSFDSMTADNAKVYGMKYMKAALSPEPVSSETVEAVVEDDHCFNYDIDKSDNLAKSGFYVVDDSGEKISAFRKDHQYFEVCRKDDEMNYVFKVKGFYAGIKHAGEYSLSK